MALTLLVFLCVLRGISCIKPNNVCPSYWDYFTIKTNGKCWYDFAAEYQVPDIIRRTGYPFMEYKVQTKDGYILTVFRIPGVLNNKPPVFMLHGVQSTSGIFVGIGKNSMAFALADAGYDVWMGNYRGTEYSEEHSYLNVSHKEFWDYSVDDIALKDVPAMLQLVYFHSGHKGKIIYIGHSLASTAAMMFASEYPETAKNLVSLFIFIGPAYKLNNMRSPYRVLFPLLYPALEFTGSLNIVQVFSRGHARRLTRPTCLASVPLMLLCLHLINLFTGLFTQISPETIPVYLNQLPGGTSLKTLTYLTEATRGRFRKYDYGIGRNRRLYGMDTPPEYNITKIKVPIHIIYANQDWTTTREDAINLYKMLPSQIRYGIYGVTRFNFNHNDFWFGRDAKILVTEPLLKVLGNFLNQTSKAKT